VPPPPALSPAEEEHVVDILSAVAILDDAQLAALVGSKRAAALRAIQRDVLHGRANAEL
jgi:hypothetical protein